MTDHVRFITHQGKAFFWWTYRTVRPMRSKSVLAQKIRGSPDGKGTIPRLPPVTRATRSLTSFMPSLYAGESRTSLLGRLFAPPELHPERMVRARRLSQPQISPVLRRRPPATYWT